jgi:diaminohydroxyphosphoribosylaminopyrimidine deaminase/5-amino-6-(5-phosphoribosylamino)uracil reductase
MNHEYYMQLALDLSKSGWPQVAPNPMVGCVIVKNNEVIASGYHQQYGQAHAEVNAIHNLPPSVSPGDCLLYVTLEPCSHFGKTPPCADLIIGKGFKTVVVGCKDPNPLVSGNGIRKLKESGIEVISGVLEENIRRLNKRFITFYEKKRPYILLKWAVTADGFISHIPFPKNKEENKITQRDVQEYVHGLRAEVMGIFVGKNTVLNDNPHLTTRLVKGKNPIRLFIDRNLEVPLSFNIYNTEAQTIVFNSIKEEEKGHISFIKLNFNENVLPEINEKLYQLQIQSVMVEGGAYLLNEFVKNDLWDEALVFQNPELYFKEGLKGPVFVRKNSFELIGKDKLFHHFKNEIFLPKGPPEKEIF